MPIKSKKLRKKDIETEYQTFKEVLLDYKTTKNEAISRYKKTLKVSKMKNDKILTELPEFIEKKKFKAGVEYIMRFLEDISIEIEELTLTSATKRLSKNKKLTHKKKSKTILVPAGFSERDYFFQLMTLQHSYKLCVYGSSPKVREDIAKTSLFLVVLAIKVDVPRYQTETLYDRYKLSLEN